MGRYYKLDADKNPVLCADVMEWSVWFEQSCDTHERIIAKTAIDELEVSTVFLGIGHCNSQITPGGNCMDYLYETMVFGPDETVAMISNVTSEDSTSIMAKFIGLTDFQKRYKTLDEAKEGHELTVNFVREVLQSRN